MKRIEKFKLNIKKLFQGRKFPIHPSFVLLFLWFMVTGNYAAFFIFVGVVLTHEFGHYIVAKRLGYKLDSLFLAPYGVSLNYKEKTFENSDEIKIALAGPCVNLALALVSVGLWWCFPESYNFTDVFVTQSIMLACFNLLPAYPMDGGRVLLSLLSKYMTRDKALRIIKIFNLTFATIFVGLFIYSCTINYNPTFALAAAFLIGGIIQTKFESKYRVMALLKKKNKNFSRPLIMYVSSEVELGQLLKHIQQNRYTVFYVDFAGQKTRILDENNIMNLTLKYPLSYSLFQIFE